VIKLDVSIGIFRDKIFEFSVIKLYANIRVFYDKVKYSSFP